MTDDAHIPQLRRVVHTDDLPVEVETEYEIRVWHDEAGAWCVDMDTPTRKENPQPQVDIEDAAVQSCNFDGTLRICEMASPDDLDPDDEFEPPKTPTRDQAERELARTHERLASLRERDASHAHVEETIERLERREKVLAKWIEEEE